jgi:hypothetical protein
MSGGRDIGLAWALAVTLAGCGTTTITTNRRDARIYRDGELIGRGDAEIRQRGLPGATTIEVRTPDGQRVRQRVERSFTGTTVASVLVMSWLGLVAMWEYPDDVTIALEGNAPSWDVLGGGSAWDAPP